MKFDITKNKGDKKISSFWKGETIEKKDNEASALAVLASRPKSFFGAKTRYESEKKRFRLNNLFHFLKKDKSGNGPPPAATEKKSLPKDSNVSIVAKEEIEDYLGKQYENRQGNEEVIRVENVFKDFMLGDTVVKVLEDINFSVNQGEFVMLVGPSGCGKSTLLHSIYGLEDPTSGKIFVDSLDIWNESKNWRADFRNRHIGFIPQQAFWIKSFSVLENIAIPATVNGESFSSALEKAAKLIQLIQMEHRSHNRPYDLSGGEQQRVAMARALLLNPKFIIADEPTGNLDQKSGDELMELFKEFNKRFNITILMVTHNPDQYKYCNKLVQMVDGRIVGQKKSK
jgi:putative ABC transport system ATP-binding protein